MTNDPKIAPAAPTDDSVRATTPPTQTPQDKLQTKQDNAAPVNGAPEQKKNV